MKPLRAALAFVGLLPFLGAVARAGGLVSRTIDLAFAALCHHEPARTLVLFGTAMCVCSRCAGVHAGVLVAAVCSWTPVKPRAVLPFGVALMLVDVLSQDLGLHPPWHVARLVTGALVGWSAAAWMLQEVGGEAGQRAAGAASARLSRAVRSASRKATCARAA